MMFKRTEQQCADEEKIKHQLQKMYARICNNNNNNSDGDNKNISFTRPNKTNWASGEMWETGEGEVGREELGVQKTKRENAKMENYILLKVIFCFACWRDNEKCARAIYYYCYDYCLALAALAKPMCRSSCSVQTASMWIKFVCNVKLANKANVYFCLYYKWRAIIRCYASQYSYLMYGMQQAGW